ncbi:hypothetical protein DRW48_05570 [Paracoccus suum]|uniref:ABM domain-containing protein n=1 Tax=Paracoccus suum TaxID=2259340 RepID=A0A344PIL6_9RHOB|nr:antibiotic biosynthesis monooxygenase [Paracoccus suum]AXC49221.1 hypothetical protein DRW48_05570 [Paracoccus suum]
MPPPPFVSMIDYTVPSPERQAEIAGAFQRIQEDWVAPYAGFRSARFLASTDGRLVRVIVEWESEAAMREFEQVSDTAGRLAALDAAFRLHDTQGSRQTFRELSTVWPRETSA